MLKPEQVSTKPKPWLLPVTIGLLVIGLFWIVYFFVSGRGPDTTLPPLPTSPAHIKARALVEKINTDLGQPFAGVSATVDPAKPDTVVITGYVFSEADADELEGWLKDENLDFPYVIQITVEGH